MSGTVTSQAATNNPISSIQAPSPMSSATTTPANNSPTSPKLQNAQLLQLPPQSRQLRPPKSPLYVPAVLRPTARTTKPPPPTPPRSFHGSLDSLDSQSKSAGPIRRTSSSESTEIAVSKCAEDVWMKDENLGEVTGSPTRDHWKADSASPNCDSPTCRSFFGLFLRRHHCRHCGHVFCYSHTLHMVPLDQNASFHPGGIPSRACDLCWNAYCRWQKARATRLNNIQQGLGSDLEDMKDKKPSSARTMRALGPDYVSPTRPSGIPQAIDQDGLAASSVPRDWSWSTF
ncbi:FYVE domain-containing protein [Histoplasma capsulatum G186AR]|nr:FYVE domain-containing protein [Histoplasma capsulatum]QSS73418.1 FYVE domain-containing protein [Histoplasma capsulatum G186AR]